MEFQIDRIEPNGLIGVVGTSKRAFVVLRSQVKLLWVGSNGRRRQLEYASFKYVLGNWRQSTSG